MAFSITDQKGRVVLKMNDKGKLALSRYPDLSEEEIISIAQVYSELTGCDISEVESFLRFDEEEETFCS